MYKTRLHGGEHEVGGLRFDGALFLSGLPAGRCGFFLWGRGGPGRDVQGDLRLVWGRRGHGELVHQEGNLQLGMIRDVDHELQDVFYLK